MSSQVRAHSLLALAIAALWGSTLWSQAPASARSSLDIARVLAAKYPAQPIMSYIPALSWSGSFRLAALTGESQWKDKPRREMLPFLGGHTPAIAEPYRLTSLAGHLAFADAAALDNNPEALGFARKAADFILPQAAGETVRFSTRWTDDMFMASSVLSRVGGATKDAKYGAAVGQLLTSYAKSLQRPDGIFIHALDGPHAWGRGNGFALLGLTEALTHLPADWTDRAAVLDIYRRHVRALLAHQSDDGSWRQVVDEPTSYRELTVTAMATAAIARGLTRGWLDAATYRAIADRGWRAVVARVDADGSVHDVCSGTGAGATKEYYLNRPAVNGADDRGGAMALLAAIEMETLARVKK
ncbi:MAG: glycoside hydrolase family 88 protein [Vicinamibacterales bacterium]